MSSKTDLNGLFANANMSHASMATLDLGKDLAQEFEEAKGLDIDQLGASEEVLYITLLLDDSGSMEESIEFEVSKDDLNLPGWKKTMNKYVVDQKREYIKTENGKDIEMVVLNAPKYVLLHRGFEDFVDELKKIKARNNVLVHVRVLTDGTLIPYSLVEDVSDLSQTNYSTCHGTPLYDAIRETLGIVVAKTQETENTGIQARSITVVLTDGHDQHSQIIRDPLQLKPVVYDMLKTENHIVAAMAFAEDPDSFRDLFVNKMGFSSNFVFTSRSAKEILRAFKLLSKSASTASKGAGSFSQVAQNGFGA